MSEDVLKNPEAGLDLVEKILRACQIPAPAFLLMPKPSSRNELAERVFEYYRFLNLRFPENVAWESGRLSYFQEGRQCILSYECCAGFLELGALALPANQADSLRWLAGRVSESNPADIVIPLPVKIQVPFLDVKKIGCNGLGNYI